MNAKGTVGLGALQGTAPLTFTSAMASRPQRLSRALRLDVAARSVCYIIHFRVYWPPMRRLTDPSTPRNRSTATRTATAAKTTKSKAPKPEGDSYFNVTGYPFPLGPLTRRRTIRREVSRLLLLLLAQPPVLTSFFLVIAD